MWLVGPTGRRRRHGNPLPALKGRGIAHAFVDRRLRGAVWKWEGWGGSTEPNGPGRRRCGSPGSPPSLRTGLSLCPCGRLLPAVSWSWWPPRKAAAPRQEVIPRCSDVFRGSPCRTWSGPTPSDRGNWAPPSGPTG